MPLVCSFSSELCPLVNMTFRVGFRARNFSASLRPLIPSGITMSLNKRSIFPSCGNQYVRERTCCRAELQRVEDSLQQRS